MLPATRTDIVAVRLMGASWTSTVAVYDANGSGTIGGIVVGAGVVGGRVDGVAVVGAAVVGAVVVVAASAPA